MVIILGFDFEVIDGAVFGMSNYVEFSDPLWDLIVSILNFYVLVTAIFIVWSCDDVTRTLWE